MKLKVKLISNYFKINFLACNFNFVFSQKDVLLFGAFGRKAVKDSELFSTRTSDNSSREGEDVREI